MAIQKGWGGLDQEATCECGDKGGNGQSTEPLNEQVIEGYAANSESHFEIFNARAETICETLGNYLMTEAQLELFFCRFH